MWFSISISISIFWSNFFFFVIIIVIMGVVVRVMLLRRIIFFFFLLCGCIYCRGVWEWYNVRDL